MILQKRKWYVLCSVDTKGEYYYNILNNEVKLAKPSEIQKIQEKNRTTGKIFSTYPIVVLILYFVRKYPDLFKLPPFSAMLILCVIGTIFIYGYLFPWQKKTLEKFPVINLSKKELVELVLIGKKEIKIMPLTCGIIFLIIMLTYIVFLLNFRPNETTLEFIMEVFLGILTPFLVFAPGFHNRSKIYKRILKENI